MGAGNVHARVCTTSAHSGTGQEGEERQKASLCLELKAALCLLICARSCVWVSVHERV